MKIALYDDYKLGVVNGDSIVDVSGAVGDIQYRKPQELMDQIIEGWTEVRPKLEAESTGKAGVAVDSVRLRAPLPRPGQLVNMAGNYIEGASPDKGTYNGFFKPNTSVIGNGDTVELSTNNARVFHFEPELGVVIGKRAANVSQADALDYVFGYVNMIDASARNVGDGFWQHKAWATSAPQGPWIVTADEIPDPQTLRMQFWVNGEQRHDFSTASMARPVAEVIKEVSNQFVLEPGDIISTGTHHEGLAAIKDGDDIKFSIERVGVLNVKCHDPLKRTWAPGM